MTSENLYKMSLARVSITVMDMETVFKNKKTIDIVSIARDVLRQWWVILIFATSIALLASTIVRFNYTPVYTTSATFVVNTQGSNSSMYSNIASANDTAARFQTILESNIFQRAIAKELGLSEYTAETTITVLDQTNLMTLEVKEKSGLLAYRYIRAILDNYSIISDYVVKGVVIDIIQQPIFPVTPSNSNLVGTYRSYGFIVGIVVAILYVAYFSYMKDTVKNPKEASSKLATRLLGSIYHEGRSLSRRKTKRTAMVITNPILSFRYVESCRLAASRVRSRMDRRKAKLLLVTSVAENEGKSTVASNLAIALSQEGKRILLIDADFRKPSLYKIFEIPEEEASNFVEILRTGEGLENVIKKFPHQDLHFILNNAATGSIDDVLANGRLKTVLKYARDKFDYVIIDTAPMGLVPDAEGIADYVDGSVVVVRQDRVLARNINDAIDTLNSTGGHVLGVIFNDASSGMAGIHSAYGYGRYGSGGYGGAYAR